MLIDRTITFGSVCSGIEAASVAWHPLGWETAWVSEIEAFPSAVLRHDYPETHNYGDFTKNTSRRSKNRCSRRRNSMPVILSRRTQRRVG